MNTAFFQPVPSAWLLPAPSVFPFQTHTRLLLHLEGIWEESDGGTHYLEIALADDGGLSFRVSDSSGRNGNTVFYTMTAYYDAILEELVYWDGTEHSAVITGEETETEESNTGEGTGMFGIVVLSDEETDDAAIGIHWLDNTFGNDGTNMFVKSE